MVDDGDAVAYDTAVRKFDGGYSAAATSLGQHGVIKVGGGMRFFPIIDARLDEIAARPARVQGKRRTVESDRVHRRFREWFCLLWREPG